jgi:hypothetical protein
MIIDEMEPNRMRSEGIVEAVSRIMMGTKVYEALDTLVKSTIVSQCRRNEPFVVILTSAESYDIRSLLINEKRASDILVEVDAQSNLYAVICLDTKVEGGFQFAQRLSRFMTTDGARSVYMVAADVRHRRYGADVVIGTLIETYFDAMDKGREGEVILRSFT